MLNLRPDRLAGVAARCGRSYAVLVAEGATALLAYAAGAFGTFWSLLIGMGFSVAWDLGPLTSLAFTFPMLCAGIALAHLFCWHLGLTYRAHHEHFPWVLQRFTGTKKERVALDAATRAARKLEREARMEALRQTRRFRGV